MTVTTKPLAEVAAELRDARCAAGGPLHDLSSVGYNISISVVDWSADPTETWIVVPVRKNLGPVGTMLDHAAFFTGPTAQADAVCAAFNQIAEDIAAETGEPQPTIAVDGNMAVGP
jgi:hypothetical protein